MLWPVVLACCTALSPPSQCRSRLPANFQSSLYNWQSRRTRAVDCHVRMTDTRPASSTKPLAMIGLTPSTTMPFPVLLVYSAASLIFYLLALRVPAPFTPTTIAPTL